MQDPCFAPLLFPPDSERKHMIFKNIDFTCGKAGKSAPQHSEHTVIRIIIRAHLDRRPQILDKRVAQKKCFLIDEIGYTHLTEYLADIVAVSAEITGDDCEVAIAEPSLPHQPCNHLRSFTYLT